MVQTIALLLLGIFAWTFIEYLIHGWLGHIFATFVTALHRVHHRDPHAVFAIRGWLPIASLWIAGLLIFGFAPGMVFFTGVIAGFTGYEALHYCLHFRLPRSALEAYLRTRHLLHHGCAPHACLGVTSPLWDLIFGTEPIKLTDRRIASIAAVAPLSGPTNLRQLLASPFVRARLITRDCAPTGRAR